MYDLILKK